ncbi:MAG: hypothetical protein AB9873_10130 [Syntrophobacteraceae bacterium]
MTRSSLDTKCPLLRLTVFDDFMTTMDWNFRDELATCYAGRIKMLHD